MSIVKSFSVGYGDTFYIRHNTDNSTIIDCCLTDENKEEIVAELKREGDSKGVRRFISTHPDEDQDVGRGDHAFVCHISNAKIATMLCFMSLRKRRWTAPSEKTRSSDD